MKYVTGYYIHAIFSFFVMLLSIWLGVQIIRFRTEGDISYYIVAIALFSIGILYFVYSLVGVFRHNVYKKYGLCIPGRIIGAERILGRKNGRYFLKIQFFDEVMKIRYTEAYLGNPNHILQDCFCNIYKWRGKYIESDFNTLNEKEESFVEIIPIKAIWSYPFFKVGRVKEIL
ncbi:MAG: hypothetical protein J6O73_11680 [Lachnospiraceae bacterium]|nr:hypothetical protein [Lachnospiraceae bacterium]